MAHAALLAIRGIRTRITALFLPVSLYRSTRSGHTQVNKPWSDCSDVLETTWATVVTVLIGVLGEQPGEVALHGVTAFTAHEMHVERLQKGIEFSQRLVGLLGKARSTCQISQYTTATLNHKGKQKESFIRRYGRIGRTPERRAPWS